MLVVLAAVLHVGLEVFDVDAGRAAADEGAELLLVEHLQPRRGDELVDAPQEGRAGGRDCPVEAVVGHEDDVADAVLAGDGDGRASGDKVDLPCLAHFRRRDAEGQRQLGDITLVGAEEHELLVELRVEGREVADVVVAEGLELLQEESRQGEVQQDALVDGLPEDAPEVLKHRRRVWMQHPRRRVGVEEVVGRRLEEPVLRVESLPDGLPDEVLEEAAAVDARLDRAELVDKLDPDPVLEARPEPVEGREPVLDDEVAADGHERAVRVPHRPRGLGCVKVRVKRLLARPSILGRSERVVHVPSPGRLQPPGMAHLGVREMDRRHFMRSLPAVYRHQHLEGAGALLEGHEARRVPQDRPGAALRLAGAVEAAEAREKSRHLRREPLVVQLLREERLRCSKPPHSVAIVELPKQPPGADPEVRAEGERGAWGAAQGGLPLDPEDVPQGALEEVQEALSGRGGVIDLPRRQREAVVSRYAAEGAGVDRAQHREREHPPRVAELRVAAVPALPRESGLEVAGPEALHEARGERKARMQPLGDLRGWVGPAGRVRGRAEEAAEAQRL
mmetsp:Transcript_38863/g.92010  ORF Transcript_38863/g.92010 Transcript_38863/m.92010 type:complete len:563 (+) Transcript_38863:783-2471(+)